MLNRCGQQDPTWGWGHILQVAIESCRQQQLLAGVALPYFFDDFVLRSQCLGLLIRRSLIGHVSANVDAAATSARTATCTTSDRTLVVQHAWGHSARSATPSNVLFPIMGSIFDHKAT